MTTGLMQQQPFMQTTVQTKVNLIRVSHWRDSYSQGVSSNCSQGETRSDSHATTVPRSRCREYRR